jgi:ATP-binding cassette subfamily C (CFTR/MRP) protein 1
VRTESAASALFRREQTLTLSFSVRSRAKHPNGQLVTHISADASFMDWCALLAHELWLQPIMIVVGLVILIHTIGYSALGALPVLVRQPGDWILTERALSS